MPTPVADLINLDDEDAQMWQQSSTAGYTQTEFEETEAMVQHFEEEAMMPRIEEECAQNTVVIDLYVKVKSALNQKYFENRAGNRTETLQQMWSRAQNSIEQSTVETFAIEEAKMWPEDRLPNIPPEEIASMQGSSCPRTKEIE